MGVLVDLDIVIPLYNSKAILPKLVKRLEGWKSSVELHFNVIFVEDGDVVSSKNILAEATPSFSYRFVRLSKNYGQHTATNTTPLK